VAVSACAAPLLNVMNARPHQPMLVKHMAAKMRTSVKVQRCTRVFSKAKHSQMQVCVCARAYRVICQRRVRALHDRVRLAKTKALAEQSDEAMASPKSPSLARRGSDSASEASEPSTSTMSALEHRGRHSVAGSPTANRC